MNLSWLRILNWQEADQLAIYMYSVTKESNSDYREQIQLIDIAVQKAGNRDFRVTISAPWITPARSCYLQYFLQFSQCFLHTVGPTISLTSSKSKEMYIKEYDKLRANGNFRKRPQVRPWTYVARHSFYCDLLFATKGKIFSSLLLVTLSFL